MQVYSIELVAAFWDAVGFLAHFYNVVVFSLHIHILVVSIPADATLNSMPRYAVTIGSNRLG